MKKQDLKDGMILETRNGDRHLLTNGVMRDFKGHMRLVSYSDDLKFEDNKKYDIIKVYKDTMLYSLTTIFKDDYLTLIWKRKEIKLTDREIEVLEALKMLGYEWLVRDKDNDLYAYGDKPEKDGFSWGGNFYIDMTLHDIFKFIKWEDGEPTKIDDLLKGVRK